MNKRGLGNVVATILIVLLVIIGVAILWRSIRPLISSAGNRVQPDCFTVELDITGCVYSSGGQSAVVSVRRGVGKGDVKAVKFVFSFASGDPLITSEVATNIDELETFTSPSIPGFAQAPQSVIVIPLVGEDKILCTQIDNPTLCTTGP